MLALEEAVDRILSTIDPLGGETVPLSAATGRISQERITSPMDLPCFDNSAMDGYAVHASDLLTASRERPVSLRLHGRVAAGQDVLGSVEPGACVRVFTGAPMPEGADAVVMQEDTSADPGPGGEIRFFERVRSWENIRLRGEDVKSGDVLVVPGDCLGAGHVGLLAAIGLTRIVTGRRPLVGILATGSELVEGGAPLDPGKIYESNRPMLAALASRAGAIPLVLPRVPDSLEETTHAIQRALGECDVLVTSGGVSAGEFDLVKDAFAKLGGLVDFWKVAIKPGKPFLCGRLGTKRLFGLPGNPVSAFVTFLLLVRPALRRLQGATNLALQESICRVVEPLANPGDRRHFMRVALDSSGGVRAAGPQASHILSSLSKAHGLVDVPAQTTLAAGASVRVLLID